MRRLILSVAAFWLASCPSSALSQELAFVERLFGQQRTGAAACEDPGASADRDVRRNAAAIARANLCLTRETVNDGSLEFPFTIVSNPRAPRGPVWYMPHDNEETAFDAAIYAVATYGGRLVAIDGSEARNFRGLDLNRAFARSAADAAPCAISRPLPAYTRYVMSQFRGQNAVLSIHNNTRGGGVSVNMGGPKATGFRAAGPLADPDNLIFIAGTDPIGNDPNTRRTKDRLVAAGLNVVHERVTRANNDCSMSNYVALNDRRPYFNLEAVHGSPVQTAMVDALMGVLGVSRVR